MMKYAVFVAVGLALTLLSACTQKEAPPAPTAFEARGVVKVITESRSYVNIDHEDIPGYMDAMAMFFTVRDSTVLDGISVNDSVRFTIEVGEMEPAIVGIERID